jgi:sulfate adenylyltransferase (ADP) / ATP adenylyltransferase
MTRAAGHVPTLPAGGLWPALLDRYQLASTAGALRPIETEQIIVEDCGVAFLARRISSLARKYAARDERDGIRTARNPFLPYEADLFVADVPPDHVALLNKYPVIPHHLLLVTRRFEAQETLLTASDFSALAACMGQIDGLAFYNGGAAAGASQPHKHLQIVPLPLSAGRERVPIEVLLAATPAGAAGRVPGLAFAHGFVRLEAPIPDDLDSAADRLMQHYRSLCGATGIEDTTGGEARRQSAPYNLLLTREWMLLVPRARECVDGISMNALGFAGCLLVRDEAQMRVVLERGPMALLRAVALAPP